MSNPDILSQLLEASWRGIPFPTVSVDAAGGHNVVPHKRVDRDGWRVENTGRNSYVFHYKIPLCNTLARGPNETWRDLFPDTYRDLISALEDRSTGDFVHPIYGLRRCKVVDWHDTIDPDWRGGPTLVVQWWETVDDGDAVAFDETSAIPIATGAAISLDASFATLTPPPDFGLPTGESLSDFLRSLGSIAGQVDLASNQILGKINRVIHALDGLRGEFSGDSVYRENTDRLISALHTIARTILVGAKSTKLYLVPKRTTIAALANRLQSTVGDLANLNPGLMSSLIVPAETPVRYYA